MANFVWSIKNGELDDVRDGIENKGIDVNAFINGRMPLHYAADGGQIEVIKYLLEKGAHVNVTDKHDVTPLLAAIWEKHTGCVKLLLDNGADPHGTTPDGISYLVAAENEEIKALLRSVL